MHSRFLPLLFLASVSGFAQNYQFSTVAGFGTFGGDAGPATAALVNPAAVAVAPDGTLYVSDPTNYRIRKIDRSGTISTFAGTGSGGFSGDGGPAANAQLSGSYNLALDAAGNLYFTDDANLRIREVTGAGTMKTVAGNGTCGTPTAGMVAANAPLCDVEGVAVDAQGRVYFGSSSQIWTIAANGTLALVAGTGTYGYTGDGGPATAAQLSYLSSLAIDSAGNIYVGDYFNLAIRKITTDKVINTVYKFASSNINALALALDSSGAPYYVTGNTQVFKLNGGLPQVVASTGTPHNAVCLAVDTSGAFYFCSNNTQRLFKSANNSSTSIAGAYPYDVDPLPAPATSVRLHLNPLLIGLAVDASNNVYFPELDGDLTQRIDKVSPNGTMTAVPTPALLPTKGAFTAQAVAIGPSGGIYFSTFTQVYKAETNGTVTLIAGAPGFPTAVGDGGPATSAKISNPSSLAFDANGNLYITEPFDSRVRKVNTEGTITTFAGTGQAGNTGDGGQAAAAKLSTPVDVKVDSQGNVYIADLTASLVRKVTPTGIISTVAGNGTKGFSGDGGQAIKAQISGAAAIALDPSGNLFIADRPSAASTISPATDNNRIRMVNTAGVMSTIAGPIPGYNGENVQSQLASLGGPVALASDAQGNIYVNESGTQRIRKLTPVAAAPSVVIASVNTAAGNAEISQNAWMEIKGVNLAPASVGTGVVWSSAPEFVQGKMPTQLNGVSVTVNGKPAFTYFVSPGQVNALSPLDGTTGNVSVVLTNGGVSSAPFTVKMSQASPSFLRFGATSYIAATHADVNASLLGAASLSVPGYAFTPAKPGETVVLYAVGFGLPNATLTNGASSQFGALTPLPVVQIGGVQANVLFAGINGGPGLYQFNVAVPAGIPDGDIPVQVSYAGAVTPGAVIAVQH